MNFGVALKYASLATHFLYMNFAVLVCAIPHFDAVKMAPLNTNDDDARIYSNLILFFS